MEKITAFLEKIDLTKLLPQLDTLLDKVAFAASLAVMVGPLVMLGLGLWYLLLPPKEANHYAGFRTWFGMGSVEAWKSTQKIAGFTWTGCGLVLTVVMWFIRRGFPGMELMDMAQKAFTCLIWQVGVAAVTYLGICITATVLYNRLGYHRWKD